MRVLLSKKISRVGESPLFLYGKMKEFNPCLNICTSSNARLESW